MSTRSDQAQLAVLEQPATGDGGSGTAQGDAAPANEALLAQEEEVAWASLSASTAAVTPSQEATQTAIALGGTRGAVASGWTPTWSQTRWLAVLLDSLNLTTVAKATAMYHRLIGLVFRAEPLIKLARWELGQVVNLEGAADSARYYQTKEHYYVSGAVNTVSLATAVMALGPRVITLARGPLRAAIPTLQGHTGQSWLQRATATGWIGTPINAREALVTRFLATRGLQCSSAARVPNSTDRRFAYWMSTSVKQLAYQMRNGMVTTYDEALHVAKYEVKWVNTRMVPRTDLYEGQSFALRDASAWAGTPVDAAHVRLLEQTAPTKRLPILMDTARELGKPLPSLPPGKMPVTQPFIRTADGEYQWWHPPPSPEAHDWVSEAYDRARGALTVPDLVEWAARFHYRVARAMPLDRGSAGLADLMTRSIAESSQVPVRFGAWRRGVAPDRRAMVYTEDEFVRRYPHFFAINDPVGLW